MAVDTQLPMEVEGRIHVRAMYGLVRISQVNFEDRSTDVASIVVGGVELCCISISFLASDL